MVFFPSSWGRPNLAPCRFQIKGVRERIHIVPQHQGSRSQVTVRREGKVQVPHKGSKVSDIKVPPTGSKVLDQSSLFQTSRFNSKERFHVKFERFQTRFFIEVADESSK